MNKQLEGSCPRGILATAVALLIVTAACNSGDEATAKEGFPAPTKGNAIAKEPVVDLNKGFEPPYLYSQDFNLEDCTFKPHGVNAFYDPLVPGFESVSRLPGKIGEIAKKPIDYLKTYKVLEETKKLNIKGLGKLEAAVVEEKEYEDGKQIQVSYNWYGICEQTGMVLAFGEDSFALHPQTGEVTSTEGSWLAGLINPIGEVAVPSVAMAPLPFLGSKTIFDGAPGVALGGAEVVAVLGTKKGQLTLVPTKEGFPGRTTEIPITKTAGDFSGCVQIQEISQKNDTRRPDLGDLTNKVWCPGVGLVYDTSDGYLVEHSGLDDEKFQKKLAAFKFKK